MKFDDDNNTLDTFLAQHGNVGAEPSLAAGTEIDGWRITGFIGRGGSSEVYCVKNSATGEPAALKILHRTERQLLDRFAREVHFLEKHAGRACRPATAAGRAGAPRPPTTPLHFPRFFAKGSCDGRPYVVQELLEPLPLPRGERKIARFLCSVAEGVSELHAFGHVHRDIKPANILWRLVGSRVPHDRRPAVPVIIDFGLLKEISTAPVRSGDNLSVVDGREVGVGTPRYAAPEQFAGGEATPATDIHALGRLAYECFEGRPPRIWARIIRRATSSIPKERYQTAGDFIRAIRHRRLSHHVIGALLGAALTTCLSAFWVSRGGWEEVRWSMLGEDVTTNVVRKVFHHRTMATMTNEYMMAGSKRNLEIDVPKDYFQTVTNAVDATVIYLNGTTNRFVHPLKLNPKREYWVVGPGTLDAVFEDSRGATMRLTKCNLVNRSDVSLKDAGIRYILYKGTRLEFPMIPRDRRGESEFLVMSHVDFPNDDAAAHVGRGPDRARVKISYKMTEKELHDELLLEKEIIRARLKQEMRHDPKFRDVDADWLVQ